MKTFKFVIDPRQDEILHQIVRICAWIEDPRGLYRNHDCSEGYYIEEQNCPQCNIIALKFGELSNLVRSLFDGWPDTDFVVDLSKWGYPVSAGEVIGTVRLIEHEKCLPEGTLSSRIFILAKCANSLEVEEALNAWEIARLPIMVATLKASVPSLSSLAIRDAFKPFELPA